ncbi:diacylglycerol kinase family protein [Dethiobacter alkaliphilus]|uniref:diacylglycerol kinase family protein n=1 Tax=Dethiobacter alkaliphilus TaxID=427926 RepID=UPI002227561F|nr:diacylglycerol kinase family protein [Dethiobacter alkaliphilus]MCW3489342.1 diacylglycerol kinase family protein [Dethiobacter alkaliphilus]
MSFKTKNMRDSFRCALSGLGDAWRSERNMRIHTLAACIAVVVGLWLGLERLEWLFLFSAVFLVTTMEMLNTALERVVDLFTRDYHPLARLAKNAAAGAALLAAFYALTVALLIFVPKLMQRFNFF